jgi:hypothetical protein
MFAALNDDVIGLDDGFSGPECQHRRIEIAQNLNSLWFLTKTKGKPPGHSQKGNRHYDTICSLTK